MTGLPAILIQPAQACAGRAALLLALLLPLSGSAWAAPGVAIGSASSGPSSASTAATTATRATATWEASADGGSIIDPIGRLAWSRCLEGMRWDGRRCSGAPVLLDHAAALVAASQRSNAEALPWRLPRVQELRRLGERSVQESGLARLMPNAPSQYHWSGTAEVVTRRANPYNYGNVMQGVTSEYPAPSRIPGVWAVNPHTGEARSDLPRSTALPVRLVRSLD